MSIDNGMNANPRYTGDNLTPEEARFNQDHQNVPYSTEANRFDADGNLVSNTENANAGTPANWPYKPGTNIPNNRGVNYYGPEGKFVSGRSGQNIPGYEARNVPGYDANGNAINDADVNSKRYDRVNANGSYDAQGNFIQNARDARDSRTAPEYDSQGRLVSDSQGSYDGASPRSRSRYGLTPNQQRAKSVHDSALTNLVNAARSAQAASDDSYRSVVDAKEALSEAKRNLDATSLVYEHTRQILTIANKAVREFNESYIKLNYEKVSQ